MTGSLILDAMIASPRSAFLDFIWFGNHRLEPRKVKTISATGRHWSGGDDIWFRSLVRCSGDWFRHRGIGPGRAPQRRFGRLGRLDRSRRRGDRPAHRRAGAVAAAAGQRHRLGLSHHPAAAHRQPRARMGARQGDRRLDRAQRHGACARAPADFEFVGLRRLGLCGPDAVLPALGALRRPAPMRITRSAGRCISSDRVRRIR